MQERVNVRFEEYFARLDPWFETVCPTRDGITIHARAVTKRKRVEEALRASEERFRRYLELGLIGMAITSPAIT